MSGLSSIMIVIALINIPIFENSFKESKPNKEEVPVKYFDIGEVPYLIGLLMFTFANNATFVNIHSSMQNP